jgi:hypothetical protein
MPIIQFLAGPLDLFQDVGRLSRPNERLRISVVVVDIVADRGDQFLHVMKDAAADSLVGEVAKEAFHHVQPRTTGRREVHVEPAVPIQPPLNLRMFVRRVVIGNISLASGLSSSITRKNFNYSS